MRLCLFILIILVGVWFMLTPGRWEPVTYMPALAPWSKVIEGIETDLAATAPVSEDEENGDDCPAVCCDLMP